MYNDGRMSAGQTEQPEPDLKEAVKWYEKSARAGYAAAELNLGLAYFHGSGVVQDFGEAIKWFHKAAGQGFPAAFDQLGIVYEHGWGVRRDFAAARKWYKEALARGFVQAERDLKSATS